MFVGRGVGLGVVVFKKQVVNCFTIGQKKLCKDLKFSISQITFLTERII